MNSAFTTLILFLALQATWNGPAEGTDSGAPAPPELSGATGSSASMESSGAPGSPEQPPSPAGPPPVAQQGAGAEPAPVTLSVRNMDITEVLSMFSRTRGLNIVTTGDVIGNVTVDLHEVPFDQALQAVVSMAGFEVVKRGTIYFVRKPSGDDPATSILNEVRTYRLNYAELEKTLPVLQQMISPSGKISGYAPTRSLVVEDRPEVLQRIDEVVRSLDFPRARS